MVRIGLSKMPGTGRVRRSGMNDELPVVSRLGLAWVVLPP
jgi:hypothetical protein